MHVTVKLFGSFRELNDSSVVSLEMPEGATAGDVWRHLAEQTPRLSAVRPGVAVNLQYAGLAEPLHDGDEIAFLPPVGGGSDTSVKLREGWPLARGERYFQEDIHAN